MDSSHTEARRRGPLRRLADPRWLLAGYAAVLAAVAFWPVPVDRGASRFLHGLQDSIPWLRYDRIEFAANIVLFVPLGILLALIVGRRVLVPAIALAVTVSIEALQAALLAQRTPSVFDVLANLLGAMLGLGIVVAAERARRRTGAGAPGVGPIGADRADAVD